MSKLRRKQRRERSSSLSYRGPAKPIPLRLPADNLSARMWVIERVLFLVGLIVVALDLFIWRP